MKPMGKILITFAVLLVYACQASANIIGINTVDVIPTQPSDADLITFNISGGAVASNSWVDYNLFSQNGTLLLLDLYVNMGALGAVSQWTYSKQIQPLVPGTYNLEVRAFDNHVDPFYGTLQDTYNTSFTVTPEPGTLAILGFGVMLARRKRS